MNEPIDEDRIDDEMAAAVAYRPSGRVNVGRLAAAVLAAAAVALLMAGALYLMENRFYIIILIPLLLGLPVFGMARLAVRWGHCRNVPVGASIGLALGLLYYGGYWAISYHQNVVAQGPFAVLMVELIGGAKGLPGYVAFRARTDRQVANPGAAPAANRPPAGLDQVMNYFGYGMEAAIALGFGMVMGGSAARRAYSERRRRWLSTFEFRLPMAALPTVRQAVEDEDWAAIADLPRVSASLENRNAISLLFRLEYLADADDEPVWLTLLETNPRRPWPKSGIPRRALRPETLPAFAEHFPDLKAKLSARPKADVTAREPEPADLHASLERLGLATPPPGAEADFRDRAVASSRAAMAASRQPDPRLVNASLCLPTGEGRREVRSAAWWPYIIGGVFFVIWVSALIFGLVSSPEKDPQGVRPPGSERLLIGSVVVFFVAASMSLVFLVTGSRVQKPWLSRRLAGRPGSLLDGLFGTRSRLLRLEDAHSYHVKKSSPDDVVICAFDEDGRRLLMEGVSHRYVIQADDVTRLWPLQAGEKISIQIEYLVGGEPLALVLTTENPMAYVFHGLLTQRGLNGLMRRFTRTLGREFPEAGEAPIRVLRG